MSREIKFRTWNKKKKIMCYGNEDESAEDWGGVYATNLEVINSCLAPNLLNCNYTYMQYTGLKDENGKEIYEEDIVTIRNESIDEKDGCFVVRWDEASARFVMYGTGLIVDFDNIFPSDVEVVGSVYANPELLEGKMKYKCKVCNTKFKLIKENRYIVAERKKGMMDFEEKRQFEAFDCPECGCQNIVGIRGRITEEQTSYDIQKVLSQLNDLLCEEISQPIADQVAAIVKAGGI